MGGRYLLQARQSSCPILCHQRNHTTNGYLMLSPACEHQLDKREERKETEGREERRRCRLPSIWSVSLLHHQRYEFDFAVHAVFTFQSAVGRVLVLLGHADQHHVGLLDCIRHVADVKQNTWMEEGMKNRRDRRGGGVDVILASNVSPFICLVSSHTLYPRSFSDFAIRMTIS